MTRYTTRKVNGQYQVFESDEIPTIYIYPTEIEANYQRDWLNASMKGRTMMGRSNRIKEVQKKYRAKGLAI